MPLDTRPARKDLTDRECATLIGGLIGSLAQVAPIENIRRALQWWLEHEQPWREIEEFSRLMQDGDSAVAASPQHDNG
jgi:hypothetical protein